MGTTGGDREKLTKDVHDSGVYAVIAPQMGKQVSPESSARDADRGVCQIVAVQAMLKYMSDRFPGAFSGYSLSVTESHQSSKVDTSGTAKAISSLFLKLGAKMDPVLPIPTSTKRASDHRCVAGGDCVDPRSGDADEAHGRPERGSFWSLFPVHCLCVECVSCRPWISHVPPLLSRQHRELRISAQCHRCDIRSDDPSLLTSRVS